MKSRIFSGIAPSGNLHVGNYLGSLKNWVEMQDQYNSIFCVVDMHAITVPQDPKILQEKTLEVAKIYLAAGIDPAKSTMFVQSHIPEHSELMWILSSIAKLPEMERMTQFKDKSQKEGRDGVGMGLLNYPTLMAADILLYDTQVVPVGEDQLQHIEITRMLARRFNQQFGETFVVPEFFVRKETMRIMALDDPTKKMSKSAISEYNYIAFTDDADTISRKIKKAVTDSGSTIEYSQDKPALRNLIDIYSAFSGKSTKEIEEMCKGKGYADFKKDLADVVIAGLKPLQEKYNALSDKDVLSILRAGADKVRPIAEKKMKEVKEKIGFIV